MSLRWRIDAAGGALELWLAEGGEAGDEAQAERVVDSFCWRLECGDPEALQIAVDIEQALRGHLAPALGWQAPVHALERSALGRRLAFTVRSAFWAGLIAARRWRPTSVGVEEPVEDVLVLTPPEAPPKPESDKKPTWYEVRVVDELGEPIAGLPLVLEVSGKHPLVTDGDGRVRVDGTYPSSGHARIEDLSTLREIVRPRWDCVRPGDWLEDEPDHKFISLRGTDPILRAVFSETPLTLVIQPWVIRARLIDMYFDTNKCFLLPSALEDIKKLRKLYDEYPDSEVLVVGHTDKTGDPSYNDPLSLERADSVAAYMQDKVEAWRAWYRADKPWDKRWGAKEDHHMITKMSGYDSRPEGESEIRWFQRTRMLEVDGWAGDETRKKLIAEYMAHDGTTLPSTATLTTHGCGESFPFAEEDLVELELVAADPNQRDRRVELYFFDRDLSVQPPPPGDISAPGSEQYPEWGRRAQETHDFDLLRQHRDVVVRILDAHDVPIPDLVWTARHGNALQEGRTTDAGAVELALPLGETTFDLAVAGRSCTFRVVEPDAFPPADSTVGAHERLNNLAYAPGSNAAVPTAELKAALTAFQSDHGLNPSGDLDSPTDSYPRGNLRKLSTSLPTMSRKPRRYDSHNACAVPARPGISGASKSEPGMRLLGHAHEGVKSNKEYADENWTDLGLLPWADAASPHAKIACDGKIIKGAGL